MKYFFRSIRYVLRYKARLAGSLACVVVIGLLWVGGLGTIIPGAKILISEEGLHGWSDQMMSRSRLGLKTVKRQVDSERRRAAWADIRNAMLVASVVDDGPAAEAGIKPGVWIVGVNGRYAEFDDLHRQLAEQEAGGDWGLLVYDPDGDDYQPKTVRVLPSTPTWKARCLRSVASRVPRPKLRADRFNLLVWVLVLGAVLTILRDLFRFLHGYLVETTVLRAVMDIRCESYATALHLPLEYFTSRGTTDTMSRFIADTNQMARGLTAMFGKTMVEPAKLVVSLAGALYLNWKLTVLACVAGPPAYFLIRGMGKLMRRATKRALTSRALLLGALHQTLGGIRVVKAYTTEPEEQRRFRAINRRLYKESKPIAAADAATGPSVEALGVMAAMIAAGVAGHWVFQEQMDREVFLGLMVLLAAMFDPVRKLSQVSTRFHAADAAAQRVFELHDQPVEKDVPGAADLPRHSRSITFQNVTFTYRNAAQPALNDVTLTITRGECVAIVGANGSGKTTLVSMLPRLLTPGGGHVLIDGADIAGVSLQSLRGQIGVVTQEAVIFHATVAENIAYGSQAGRDQIVAAAKQAFVDEFVQVIPGGYDAMIGERGSTLSGGQRQRIAIARAILRDPAIMIFDEAMSQIDSESEAKIHQALEAFMVGRTTLLIAHRFTTVTSADRVVVMDTGRIVDIGSHDELLERCKVYRALFDTQLTGGPTRSKPGGTASPEPG